METKHTPTSVDIQNYLNGHKVSFSKKEMKEFILRAVNSQAALLRLVKRHRAWLKVTGDVLTVEDRDWIKEADKAVAQAEKVRP